jgi:hypothetical protein
MQAPFPFAQPSLSSQLDLPRCPHCSIALPHIRLQLAQIYETKDYRGENRRFWRVYFCATCGGGILAGNVAGEGQPVIELYPSSKQIDESVPYPASTYLQQALESIHAPAGAVMLAASAIDAMLKTKGYQEGSLFTRINQAAEAHLITREMAEWAHEIRLDANDQRHADVNQPLPDETQAKKCVDFALALAEFLFVLPARVQRGRTQ